MKSILTSFLCLMASFAANAQLTKVQTYEYLRSKFAETVDITIPLNSQLTYTVNKIKCMVDPISSRRVILNFERAFSNNTSDVVEYSFDPTHIAEVTTSPTSASSISYINLKFNPKTLVTKRIGTETIFISGQVLSVPYLSADKLNAERLQKAFMHLKKLYEESKGKDPFVN